MFTTQFNDSSILITIISCDYLNLSLANEYVGDVIIPTQVIKHNQNFSKRISQSDCNIHFKLNYFIIQFIIYRLIHGHFHIGLVIIPRPPYWPETQSSANMGRGMITRPIWKCPCIKPFITYFRHLEKRHPYWPGPTWASIWKWSCSNPITGYFPGVWKYGQFTSGHIGHTKMSLFTLSM